MIRCRNGHENPVGATYCSTCHIIIDTTAQPEPEPEPQPAEPEPEPQPEPEPEPQPEPEPEAETLEPVPWPTPPVPLSAELQPETSKGTTAGKHTLTVHNSGSVHLAGEPAIAAVADDLTFELEPATLSVAPGTSASTRLRARPKKPLWIGRARTHPFRIAVAPEVGVDGAMVQRARLPIWLLALVVALLAAGIVAAVVVTGGDGEVIPTERDVTVVGHVTARSLNVRETPNGKIIESLPRNTEIQIQCITVVGASEWDLITSPSNGFVFDDFVDRSEDPELCP